MKTVAGTLSRTLSRIASSWPSGSPDDASSVPKKYEFDALVEAVEDGPVDFLEVEGEVEGAPHALVLELVAPEC